MGRLLAKSWILLAVAVLFAGCAAPKPVATGPGDFTPVDLNPKVKAGTLVQKVNSFMLILDASGSMDEMYKGRKKICKALAFAHRLNSTLPDVALEAGLRTFGRRGGFFKAEYTTLLYGIATYSKADFGNALNQITAAQGLSPLDLAIRAAIADLANAKGKMAVIIISDGKEMDKAPVAAAKSMKSTYGERVCIYTVGVGEDKAGLALLKEVAQAGACGFYINADDALSPQGMAQFVERVFFEAKAPKKPVEKDSDGDGVVDSLDICPHTPRNVKVDIRGCPLDSDRDGVYDYLDDCPGTPKGVKVDPVGCPLDTDRDGVYDYKDKCPNTPRGVKVNERGCWILKGLTFDTAKWDIKPQYFPLLEEVVTILKKNPSMRLEIQGHTDSMGSPTYNQKLSQRRAEAIKQYLIRAGISPERLKAVGFGESQPVASNATDEGRAKNRRVELHPIF